MPDVHTVLGAEDARRKLFAIPGVLRVGIGLKETAGEVVEEWVLRVYVADKKPADELAAHERIPPEVDGISTDVLVLSDSLPECSSALKPGMQITREVLNTTGGYGSIGCFVEKEGQFYILTNQHVIVPLGSSISDNVYQPKPVDYSQVRCNDPVATVVGEGAPWAFKELRDLGPDKVFLDCALIRVANGVSFVNELPDGPLAQPIRDLVAEAKQPGAEPDSQQPAAAVVVHKRGATTDLTQGTIVEICAHERIADGTTPIVWRLSARPTAGSHHYSETYDIHPDEPSTIEEIKDRYKDQPVKATQPDASRPRRLHFEGSVFSRGGDSGSVWVDANRRVVGLHDAGGIFDLKVEGHDDKVAVPTGRGEACHINNVFSALGLNPATAVAVGSHPTAGAAMLVPGSELALPLAQIAAVEASLTRRPAGRRLVAAVRRHEVEVRSLIHHRRRVMLAWHRSKGPAFVAQALNEALEGSLAIPREVAGRRLDELVREMLAVLRREGSPELQAVAAREGPLLVELARSCITPEDVLAHLDREASGAAA